MKALKSTLLAAGAVVGFGAAPALADTITFDGTGAPCNFANTTPLTSLYAAQGVTFSGVGGTSGSILNQCGGFGINARSGTDFLAFNTNAGTAAERVSFTPAAGTFQLYVGARTAATFTANYFDLNGISSGTDTVVTTAGTYGMFFRQGTFSSVVFSSTATDWVADDFSFRLAAVTPTSGVPEPATWAMMMLGFGGMGYAMRRKNKITARICFA